MRSVALAVGSRAARSRPTALRVCTRRADGPLHSLAAFPALNNEQRRRQATQAGPPTALLSRKPSPPSFGSRQKQQHGGHAHGRDTVVAQLQKAVSRASGKPPEMEFLRHATTLLQSAQTPEQLRAAVPLCRLVENAETIHGSATAECVRVYEAVGRHREAIELALRLLRYDFFLMNSVLASALQACTALRDADRGFEIFALAVERGTIPNRNVFGVLLALSATAGDAPDAPRVQELLAKMAQSDADMNHTTFHQWLMAYAKTDRLDVVETLFEDMEIKFGLSPVAPTYAVVMDAFAERGDYDKTVALLEQLQRADGLQVDNVHYNIALKACGKTSQLTRAFDLYEDMKAKKIKADLVTYITMMHAVFHGELGGVDPRKVKAAMAGVGAVGLASVPLINFQEQLLTFLFCTTLVGSMGLAVYMNPDGAMRTLYPNGDEPRTDTVIEAFFRRLREEDHCGRSMYLWREMLKYGVVPDSRVYDVLVRTCVKKRHPELAFEAIFEQNGVALVDAESGHFMLPLATTVGLVHSLLAQRRIVMADTVFDTARTHRAFRDIFHEAKDVYTYDLRAFPTPTVRSYAVRRLLSQLHAESKLFGSGKAQMLPRVEFLVLHGFELLDQLDMDDPQVRELFSMDEMKRETSTGHRSGSRSGGGPSASAITHGAQFFFRLNVPRERLAAFFAAPLASATQQKLNNGCPDAAMASGVQVSCRLRGLSANEQVAGRRDAVFIDPADPHCTVGVVATPHAFHFDHVFSTAATQEEVFASVGVPCLHDLFTGYNCTLLAYGQTGSGKTYTTIGDVGSAPPLGDSDGLVPRLLERLFIAVAQEPHTTLTASFIEVYQERLRDLLLRSSSSASSSSLRIREGKGGVWVDGVTEISLLDLVTARAALRRGLAVRSVGATSMNRDSSRSHAVFAVTLTRHTTTGESVRARLCVVDLAGSEQAKKTRASGTRLDEAKHINRSLSALGNVIHALTASSSSNSNSPSHVPYRDSKLTRLLQSSLGGNAKTHLLITCATADCHIDETLSTLRFGARASRMRNTPTVNLKTTETSGAHQRELLETLQRKVESLCRYIRELEDAAVVSASCQCGSVFVTRDEVTMTPVSTGEDLSAVDPVDDEDDAATSSPLSSDLLMQAELVALRKALDDLQQLQQHTQSLTEAVTNVEHDEMEKLHRRQAGEIETLDAQLTLAEGEKASLDLQLREQLHREHELQQKLAHYESRDRRDGDATSAESEILRRQLQHSERLLKTVQLELAASRAEVAELRQRVERGDRDRDILHDELLAARCQLQSQMVPLPSLPSPRPRGNPTLRPVTVAAVDRSGSSTAAIQSWWAGEPSSTNNREEEGSHCEELHDESLGTEGMPLAARAKASSAGRCCRTSLAVGRPRLDTLETAEDFLLRSGTSDAEDNCDREQQLHTSGGARPFRARLIGLLNSLEAETSSYKELLQVDDARLAASSSGLGTRPRPAHPRSHTRRHRLPELSASSTFTTPTGATQEGEEIT